MTPYLLSGVRLHFDKVRNTNVLLAPERALMLDGVSYEILRRVDGIQSVVEIVEDLARAFDAPAEVIRGDVDAFLNDLKTQLLVGDRDA
ncbi:MAG: pyrroloquinoline quinone biosynthesis peptide chaperone PqqD [Oceanicola sp.]|nr:pyrroloquinoline quinone biosynthesis peptide chaperone PqqD [Oceanicola sp.]